MKLIYVWVGRYKNIVEQGFLFDRNYDIQFKYRKENIKGRTWRYNDERNYDKKIIDQKIIGERLIINKVNKPDRDLGFPENIENVYSVIGKNGTGKSALLELISNGYNKTKTIEGSYFLLYATSDKNKFIIEGKERLGGDNLFGFYKGDTGTPPFSYVIDIRNDSIEDFLQFSDFSDETEKRLTARIKANIEEDYVNEEVFFPRVNLDYFQYDASSIYRFLNSKKHKRISDSILNDFFHNAKLNMDINLNPNNYNRKKQELISFKSRIVEKKVLLFDKMSEKYPKGKKETVEYHLIQLINSLYNNLIDITLYGHINRSNDRSMIERLWERLNKKLNHNSKKDLGYFEKFYQELIDSNYNNEEIIKAGIEKLTEYVIEYLILEYKLNIYNEYNVLYEVLIKAIEIESEERYMKKNSLFYNNFKSFLESIPEENMNMYSIEIPLKFYNENISNFLNLYSRILNSENYVLNMICKKINLKIDKVSDGELHYLMLFSKLYKIFDNASDKCNHILLLLDEVELYFHPEWCRTLLKKLIIELKNYPKFTFKIVFATHSPFLISELPRENVILLKVNEKGESRQDKDSILRTYGTNIHTLFKDGMFLDTTIGEKARENIKNLVESLNSFKEKELSNEEMNFKLENKERFLNLINLIGEDVLRKSLLDLYYEVYPRDKDLIFSLVNNLSEEERKSLIYKLKGKDGLA